MKKILVIQTAFLGDAILATALLESLHASLPDTEISLLVRNGNEGLFKDHPFLHEVLVWNKKESKIKNLFKILAAIRQGKYDAVINLHRFLSSGILTAFSGAVKTSGFDKNPLSFLFSEKVKHIIGDGRHEVERNLDAGRALFELQSAMPRLYPTPKDDDAVSAYKSKTYVTMAPASIWFTKKLPAEKWIEMIKHSGREHKIFLVGSAQDTELCDQIIKAAGNPNAINLAGRLNLLQTASLSRDAIMNYVNDSAPLHISSAVNAPVTAFFCSTVPGFGFGPLSRKSHIIETKEILECKPCGLHGRTSCPLGHFKCAHTIIVPVPGREIYEPSN